jgi:DNA-binding GntR family transcriptional regulator
MRIAAHAPQAEPTISAGMEVLTRLRESILTGHYGPGEKLRFADLQNDFAAGIGTLREALSQLVGEGLVTVDAGRGFRVAPVSRDDLLDITALHVDFERRAARDSVANGDDEWEARVLTAFHRLSKIENLSKAERLARHAEWVQRHREFHEALVSACRSRWLLNFRAILFDQSERYRLLSKRYRPEGSPKLREHVIIKDAALARDAARTADLLARHIEETAENVLKVAPQFTAAGALAANAREAARPGRKTRRNPASQRVRGKA